MANRNTQLFNRSDTMFGVCQGLGEDIGISPNCFRLAFAGLLFWHWEMALPVYAACGVLVYTLRWLMPDRVPASAPAATAIAPARNDAEPVALAEAA